MFTPFLKRIYLFTLITTIIGLSIFIFTGNVISYTETIISIIGVYFKIVLPISLLYLLWRWIRDGLVEKNKIILIIVNSIVYTILSIDILIILFYIVSLIKK